NQRASEIRERKPGQIVSLLTADELICIGRCGGHDCECRLSGRSTGGNAKTCRAFSRRLGRPSARKRHGKRAIFVKPFGQRQRGNCRVIVCDPFRSRRRNATPCLGSQRSPSRKQSLPPAHQRAMPPPPRSRVVMEAL